MPRHRATCLWNRILPSFMFLGLFLVLGDSAMAQNENETVGFSSTHVFDGGLFEETVDTLNGNLTLTIPIGPNYQVNKNLSYQLQLTYNSKVWEYMDRSGLNTKTKLWGQSPFGVGFSLSMGRVYRDVTYPNDIRWYFQSPDGNRHDLGPNDCWGPGGRNTVDRTYINVTPDAGATCSPLVLPTQITIKDGSGKRYTLGHRVEIPGTPCANCVSDWRELNAAFGGWYVTLIEDMTSGVEVAGRFPNWVQVDYDWDSENGTGVGYGQCIKRITDSLGRETLFTNYWNLVDKGTARTESIQFPSFANSATINNTIRSTYSFHYTVRNAFVPIVGTPAGDRDKGPALFLDSIDMPLGLTTTFDYDGGTELVSRTLPMNESGAPTGPRIKYTYNNYDYFKSFILNGAQSLSGDGVTRIIEKKELLIPDADPNTGDVVASWTYTRSIPSSGHATPDKVVVRTNQVSPSVSNDVVYFFRSSRAAGETDPLGAGPNANDGFAPEWDDGLNYRTEYWVGSAGSGRLLRTEETVYEPDSTAGLFSKNNVRVNQTTVTFNDEAGKQLVTTYSEWDNLGHWKVTTESGSGLLHPRVTRTQYVPKGTSGASLHDTYEYKEITDGGTVLSRSDYAYDTRGRLTTSIDRLTLPTSVATAVNLVAAPGDVVTTYTYDEQGIGNVTRNTGNVIRKAITDNALPAAHAYTINYVYNLADGTDPYGLGPSLASKRFEGVTWKSIDWQRDGNTGLIRSSCDPSGFCTNYNYDFLGRITRIIPPNLENPTAIRYASLHETEVQQSSNPDTACTGDACIFSKFFYDDMARLIRTEKRQFDGSTVAQRTTYDALSRVLSQSEWVKLGAGSPPSPVDITTGLPFNSALNLVDGFPSTTYDYTDLISGGQDPFGRAWTVKTADNTTAEPRVTQIIHRGLSTAVTVRRVNGSLDEPVDVTTTYTKDVLGRLVDVSYPTGRNQAGQLLPMTAVKAEYGYDLEDNLTSVLLIAPDLTTQGRTFTYDGLNRLAREDNPENGATLYEAYDPIGNLLQKRDSAGNIIAFVYDVAGRLKETRSNSPSGTLLSRNTYDLSDATCSPTSPDPAIGKLAKGESFSDTGILQFTQKYCYQGLNGRLSGESTLFPDWVTSGGLKTVYSYDLFGLRTRTIYPNEGGGHTLRDVTASYRNGFQSQVADTGPGGVIHAYDIQYNPAGGLWKIQLPGTQDVVNPDARNRPRDIGFTGPSGSLFSSGLYSFDGAGNISHIGINSYRYDSANRLVEAIDHSNDSLISYNLAWVYDPFGNMIRSSRQVGAGSTEYRTFCPAGTFPCDPNDLRPLPNNRITRMKEGVTTDTFVYDVRGNVVRDQNYYYDFDKRNRLTTMTGEGNPPDPQGAFVYDSSGKRVRKTVDGISTYYVRDQQGEVLSEFRKATNSNFPPAWDRDYLYASGRLIGTAENENPETPPGFKSKISSGNALLEWEIPPDLDLQGYKVYRRMTSPTWSLIGTITSPTTTSFSTPLSEEEVWSFRITSTDQAGHESDPTQGLSLLGGDATIPSTPTALQSEAGDRRVTLSWSGSTDNIAVLGYQVLRNGIVINPTSYYRTTSAVDVGLTNGQVYLYRVRAVDTAGNLSGLSSYVLSKPQDNSPPPPPLGILAFPGCGATANSIEISWLPNSPDDGVTIYKVFRHDKNGAFDFSAPLWTSSGTPPPTAFQDVSPVGTPPFSYVVIARDAAGHDSVLSTEVRAALRSGAFSTPLVAFSGDGRITLKWNGTPSCSQSPCSFALYRKWSVDQGCEAFQRIGTVPLAGNSQYSYTDWGIINTVMYDYTLSLVDKDGNETQLSSIQSSIATSVPLEPIKDVRRCRILSNPPTDPCSSCSVSAGNCPNGTWSYRWNPPSAAVYQPIDASPFQAPEGYLKGYHVYRYYPGCCDLTPDLESGFLQRDDGGSAEQADFGLDSGRDAEYLPDSTHSEFGQLVDPDWCHVITGVYKVFYNGEWRTEESGWSDNFNANEPEIHSRCPNMPIGEAWCDLPRCDVLTTPPPPGSVLATPETTPNQIRVSWTRPNYNDLAGYYLYVNDPTWGSSYSSRARSVFRKDHPYLYLGPDETSAVLTDLDPCRSYSFYMVSVGGSGRISDPSPVYPTSGGVNALAPTAAVPPPTNLRARLWTTNDKIYGPDEGYDSRRLIRLKWDYECHPGATFIVEQSTDGQNWSTGTGFAVDSSFGYERTMFTTAFPIGTTIYYRVKAVLIVNGQSVESTPSMPVATGVVPYGDTPLSPPSNFHAFKDCETSAGPKLTWCPNPGVNATFGEEEEVTHYRIYRSTTSGGPYTQIEEIPAPGPGDAVMPTYTDNSGVIDGIWYYYVVAAVRNDGGVVTLSSYSRENVAGCVDPIPGGNYNPFDPDSPKDIENTNTNWKLLYCQDDYVSNEFLPPVLQEASPFVLSLDPGAPDSQPAPYRVIGTGPSFHYTYYHLDHLGSPRVLTDSAGIKVQDQHFLPFGEEMPVQAGLNSKKFTGHERDPETGLDYMMARYYPSNVSRFTSPDPGVDIQVTNPQSWNRYAYVQNNPMVFTDPTGMYGKGKSFNKTQWRFFNSAQQHAAKRNKKAADKLRKLSDKLQSGQKLSGRDLRAISKFETAVGKTADAAGRMQQAADSFDAANVALNDDGTNGYVADGYTGAEWTSPSMGNSPDDAAAGVVGGKGIDVNLAHPALDDSGEFQRIVSHEALHNSPAGLTDQKLSNGQRAYAHGDPPGLHLILAVENPHAAIKNPDSLLAFEY